jgi:hypothetical protein
MYQRGAGGQLPDPNIRAHLQPANPKKCPKRYGTVQGAFKESKFPQSPGHVVPVLSLSAFSLTSHGEIQSACVAENKERDMRQNYIGVLALLTCCGLASPASADILGTAQNFAVLGGSTVTNTGPTVITAGLGVWPGTALTGLPPGVVNGTIHASDAVAQQAQSDMTTAYNALAGMTLTQDLTGMDLGGLTLVPGVYFFSSSAFLTGTLTLNAMGNPDALFVFQIGSTLISASNSSVVMINSADACDVYWQVGSSATLGTDSAFQGNILALTSITMNTRASLIEGRALARNGAVTMDSNIITAGCIPTPGTTSLLGMMFVGAIARRRR